MKLIKYRVVKDKYLGYECQIWRLWWPFWCQIEFTNTHMSLERAKDYIEAHRQSVVWSE